MTFVQDPAPASKISLGALLTAFFAGVAATVAVLAYLPTAPHNGPRLLRHPPGVALPPLGQRPPRLEQAGPPPLPPFVERHRQYQMSLPEDALRQGLYLGSGRRLLRFAAKLARGAPVKVVTLGGSVTAGAGAVTPAGSYPAVFASWLNATFPHPRHQLLNRGIGGTTCGIFALCLDKMAPQDPDLVTVEFTFNEPENLPYDGPHRKAFEQLLRKLLRLPSRPAVVVLHHYSWWFATATRPDGSQRGGVFWGGAEPQLSQFSHYYDVPSVSLRGAAYHLMRRDDGNFKVHKALAAQAPGQPAPAPGPGKEGFYYDLMHPNDFGHRVLGDLLVGLTWQAVLQVTDPRAGRALGQAWGGGGFSSSGGGFYGGLGPDLDSPGAGAAVAAAQQPGGAAAAATAVAAGGSTDNGTWPALPGARRGGRSEEQQLWGAEELLPPPMIPGNEAPAGSTCFIQEDFKGVVVNASGFAYAAHKPGAPTFTQQKWSWSGNQPGDWAEVVVDTRHEVAGAQAGGSGEGGAAADAPTSVVLGYQRSYETMGSARVACVAGCACQETVLEAAWERRATLMQMHQIWPSQHAECRIRVTILPETKTGGHKVSLTFLMYSPYFIALSAYESQVESVTTGAVFGGR